MPAKETNPKEVRADRLIPAREHREELAVVNSRFLVSIAPARSVEEARAFIRRIKREFKDATHNVPAFVIGHGASTTEHCHDDGEPSGTAGRPMLAVLRGSGIGDIVVVVTRYFGGTKLGKGGLVRAYSDSVRTGLKTLPLTKKVAFNTLRVALPYALFERIRMLVADFGGEILEKDFGAEVTLIARVEIAETEAFRAALKDASRGRVEAEVVSEDAI